MPLFPDNHVIVSGAVSITPTTVGTGAGASPLATGAITGIPATVLTTIVTYTATTARQISRISCSGNVYGKFQVFKNTILIDTIRSGPERSEQLLFTAPINLVTTDIVDVKVTHYQTGVSGDFESTIYGG